MAAVVHLVGVAAAVWVGGAVVARGLERVVSCDDEGAIEQFRARGLEDGGRYIGYLERFLFYIFVAVGSYAAVGVVLALKGIIRHAEIRGPQDQKVAEYVLVGTMLSLAWTLVVSVVVESLRS
jgi:hypothetical protein